MAKATLTISSKNYSSWSLRGWLLTKFSGLEFEEIVTAPDDPSARAEILLLSSSILVPCLRHDGATVWDTLAIAEYLAERFPEKNLWPADRAARARARSVCAEMHSGFGAMRNAFGMNIEASLPEVGERVLRDDAAVRNDVERIIAMWTELLESHRGPMLFGAFSIVAFLRNTIGSEDIADYAGLIRSAPITAVAAR